MQNNSPSVSLIIPTYNRASWVVEAIDSCLSQDIAPRSIEVIVVDDGSTDSTASTLTFYLDRIRFISLGTNQGRNAARNAGLAAATGDYVKFLDSDDVLEPGSLCIEMEIAYASNADIVVSGCQAVEIGPERIVGRIFKMAPPIMEPRIDCILAGNAAATSSALYLRAALGTLRWDEKLRKLDDWDWFIRAALQAKTIAQANLISYSWRQHGGQGIRSETMLHNAHEHHAILRKMEEFLLLSGDLTTARRERLAQYFYKECRVLSLHDPAAFHNAVDHIYELDPNFVPRDEERQWWMRALGRLLGVRRTVSWHTAIKKLIKRDPEVSA